MAEAAAMEIARGQKGKWCVYVVASQPRPLRTYCGVTNDFPHRLRQHNGEIKGGARATHSDGPWRLAALVHGFGDDKATAMRCEWFAKVGHYRGALPKCPAPMRRAFLLRYAMEKCQDRCGDMKLDICDPDMLSTERFDLQREEAADFYKKRQEVLTVVTLPPAPETPPAEEEEKK